MKENKVVKLTEREHALQRPSMYIGSVSRETKSEYIVQDKITKKDISYSPGLIKIVNEVIDNAVDEAIRMNFRQKNKSAFEISIKVKEDHFEVQDTGRGIPVVESILPDKSKLYQPELAWTHARAGSNFNENSNTIGTNGLGVMLTNVYSKKFIGISKDGRKEFRLTCSDNMSKISSKISDTKENGVYVKSYPDFERFGSKEFTKDDIELIYSRVVYLAVSYPEIVFKFNNKQIRVRDFIKMFSDSEKAITLKTDKYQIGILPSSEDGFCQFSLMNGLILREGGSHIEYLNYWLTTKLTEKVRKKYKDIKPNDIKQKLFIVCVMNEFIDPKYDSQTKEKLTNSQADIRKYFGEIDFDKLADQVYKNKSILDSIIELFKIKEEFKKRQELKGLEKTQKKIKSDKYLPAVGETKYIFLAEGDSATGGLSGVLGRKGNAFISLKGKPANIAKLKGRITSNEELSLIYKVIKNTMELEDLPDGKFYEITIKGKSYIVNENDIITLDNKKIDISNLLRT